MKYVVNKNEHPIYLQIYKQIRDDIVRGVYAENSRLPSKRMLAEETEVSTITVEHAYALLCDEGYAEARERSGFFVVFKKEDGFALSETDTKTEVPQNKKMTFYPSFPISVLSKTMRRVLSQYEEKVLETSPNTGCEMLKTAIKRYLARNRGIDVETNQLVVGSGAEYLYGLIINLLGRDKIYAIEAPSYEKLEKIYAEAGVEYELLNLTEDGIDTKELNASQANVLHTTPYRSVPTGVSASASKRHEYIRWSNRNDRYIIESDYGSEFSVAAQPAETLFSLAEGDNVIYLNTFSKTISSSMRVGYMVLPKKLVKVFDEKLGFYSCSVPTFEQLVLTELINSGDFERHINKVRRNKRRELKK